MVNLNKTWQECSLNKALQNLLKGINFFENSGCHGSKMAENGKNLLESSYDKPEGREHSHFV